MSTEKTLIQRLNAADADFPAALQKLVAWEGVSDAAVNQTVQNIIADVRRRGDAAVIEYTNKFDRTEFTDMSAMTLERADLEAAWGRLSTTLQQALEIAVARVREFHQRQCQTDWQYTDASGTVLGQRVTPVDRVGVYVPGGSAPLASSVVMTAVTAKVAGVPEVIMAHPTPDGDMQDFVLAAAYLSGVDRVITMGGAQAIAALAYGTETIPGVDKIVGPGNIYVATAKRYVFGQVGIDMIAGPSEILVVCDGKTDPDWIAMDLFSQAEHDPDAQAILVSPDADFLDQVAASIDRQLPTLERAAIARQSLTERGALILVRDLEQAMDVVNQVAPEHLELSVEDPEQYLPRIRHAGAIFLGRYTSEALGDYVAGPNHVLPTSGTARFSSPLGVYDFQKKTSIIQCTADSASELGRAAGPLARGEQLTAHARSAELRIKD
ncbi:histidinol dehydrogenase [Natronospirillum operosum]|uniref:Histidinol dehydrogenase n=1 Tax=Natronospirillum operosum TaxID=2759953 RepID=A0A4Z0WAN9_9GAMM|nr:histidinol dehydrogenase [Natronospirillum operosum]TGG90766.1 histidinol dehydrogenase [Natronospirillum operosum]